MAKRFAIVIGAAAAGVMALGPQPAAAVVTYDTRLQITTERGFLYHGNVLSDSDRDREWHPATAVKKCERGRRVVVFNKVRGRDRVLGHRRSVLSTQSPKGVWGWDRWVRKHGGHVYAKVRPKERDQFACRADRTPIYDGDPDVAGRV